MTDLLNACGYLVDRQVAAGNGGRCAIRCEGTETSYDELQSLTARFAGALAGLGVRTGDRVVMVCSDRTELAVAILGTMRHGAIAVPVSTMYNATELATIVRDSGTRVVLVSPEFVGAVAGAVAASPDVAAVVAVGGADLEVGIPTHGFEELIAAAVPEAVAATSPDFPALWLYTSGTTGLPKGAMHRHANLVAVCDSYARDVLGIGPDDVCFSIAKLFFAYGLGNSLLFPLSVGACSVLEPRRPSPQIAEERLVTDRPSLFFAAPTFYAALCASTVSAGAFASVRLSVSAGEALPAPLHERFTTRFGVELLDGIGSTEELHIFLSNHPGHVRPGTTGTPVAGYDLELRDEFGRVVDDGETGILFVRGPSMATGYWCRTDATRQVFQGEWLRTGDSYVRSIDGYFTCLGRASDLLKAGGIWVSPYEVETRLLEHPHVSEAVVVGVTDRDGLDKPVAFVVAEPGTMPTADDLVAWCREGLASFKRPRAVVLVEEIPKTATGKVQRFRLRDGAGPALLDAPIPAVL
jgi:benzoate-CoA ligase family protein